ncbi:hypothetical protein HUJ05_008895 [Dendroctonus ponderosae]|nr:hypothetical protein HUJ05_008894 [Dendroctonus ponderosae]KAH1008333.1 hypothetical protein HUJ05_008895 [Dendroctonus ponderosae]
MAKTYPGADIDSDHNLLVGEFRVQSKKLKAKESTTEKRSLNQRTEQQITNAITGPDILLDEIEAAMMTLKDGKTAGPVEVQDAVRDSQTF